MTDPADLCERLEAPKRWCCIFEHEGQMCHGTTDAPFQAAARIRKMQARIDRAKDRLPVIENIARSSGQSFIADEIRLEIEALSQPTGMGVGG